MLRLFLIVTVMFLNGSVYANTELSDIRFRDENWSSMLLSVIDSGPVGVLRSDQQYDLPSPPSNDSDVTTKEIAYLHKLLEKSRTFDAVQRIIYEDNTPLLHDLFVNEGLLQDRSHKTRQFLTWVNTETYYFILERKKFFARPRPSELDPTLDTVVPNPPHASYPSGHAAQAHMFALILADFDPVHAERYIQFAYDVAHRREIAGIHYPSDSEAGRELAEYLYKTLRANPDFEKQYQEAKLSYIKPKLEE